MEAYLGTAQSAADSMHNRQQVHEQATAQGVRQEAVTYKREKLRNKGRGVNEHLLVKTFLSVKICQRDMYRELI